MSGIRRTALLWAVLSLCVACEQQPQWTEAQRAVIQSISLASLREAALPDSNRVAGDAAAVDFGRRLFHDPKLSGSGKLSCASCHQPEKRYTDGLALGAGEGELARNTPTLLGLAWHDWFYWDGRKDSLWSQSLAPIEASVEMNSSRLMVVRRVIADAAYRASYEKLFGQIPDGLLAALPNLHASPYGSMERQNNWHRLPNYYREQVNRIFANTGKAIGAFERTLRFTEARFDQYASLLAEGNLAAANRVLSEQERAGLGIFIDDQKSQCLRCHNGPLLTNFDFHNIGSGTLQGERLDFGRMLGLQSVMLDEFNCLGRYSDAPRDGCRQLRFANREVDETLQGAYKTPSLRELRHTAPYFHDGRHETLIEALQHYNNNENTAQSNRLSELNPISLTQAELIALQSFLLTLSAP